MTLSSEQARTWLDRWDRQQEVYIADREERFTVIGDVVAAVLDGATEPVATGAKAADPAATDPAATGVESAGETERPLIVDLGVGPGSLSARLARRFPNAEVVGVDADPLLLGLARAGYGDLDNLRVVQADLRDPDWVAALGVDRVADAIVSTTALHWLTASELGGVFRAAAALLRAGGVFVDGDNIFDTPQRAELARIAAAVGERRAERVLAGARSAGSQAEDWAQWWAAAAQAEELAALVSDRGARAIDHHVDQLPGIDDHLRLLGEAGFAEAGTVWQVGDDRILVAVR